MSAQIRVGIKDGSLEKRKFIFTIDTKKPGSASDTFVLPCGNIGVYNATIEWGDGTTSTITSYNDPDLTHVYSTPGIYTVKVLGTLPHIRFNSGGDSLKLMSINNWGNNEWRTMSGSFRSCSNLEIYATDVPNTSLVTSLTSTFQGCTSLTSFSMKNWDLSSCTTFGGGYQGTFNNCTSMVTFDFTGCKLNTTTNITMREAFWGCSSLSSVVGFNTVDTSKVTSLYYTFKGCSSLTTLDMSGMDLSNCSDTTQMFLGCTSLTSLDMSNITFRSAGVKLQSTFQSTPNLTTITGIENWVITPSNIISTFRGCGLTGDLDLTGWDVSNVTSTSNTFSPTPNLTSLNVSGWDLSSCTTFGNRYAGMFNGCGADSIDVTGITIRTSGPVIMYEAFYGLGICDVVGLDTWDISTVSIMNDFLRGSTITTTEYDKLLVAWDNLDPVDGLSVNFGTSKYTSGSAAETSRSNLISNDLWTITDGGGI